MSRTGRFIERHAMREMFDDFYHIFVLILTTNRQFPFRGLFREHRVSLTRLNVVTTFYTESRDNWNNFQSNEIIYVNLQQRINEVKVETRSSHLRNA